MKAGDICLLYIGSPYCAFAGYAVLGESPRAFTKSEQIKLLDKKYRRKPESGVRLDKIKRFNIQVPAPLAVPELPLIKNKKNWGMYFQGAAVKISEADFNVVEAIACMLNSSLKKSHQAKSKKNKNGSIMIMQKAFH
jgi:hypothetical protein